MNPKLSTLPVIVGALLVGGASLSCSSTHDGTLQQNWTIQGNTSSTACDATGSAQMRVVVVNSGGGAEATNFVPCNTFVTSFSLHPDTYTGTATFLNANGLAVSQTKILPAFTISEDQTTLRTIDFALTDFLPR